MNSLSIQPSQWLGEQFWLYFKKTTFDSSFFPRFPPEIPGTAVASSWCLLVGGVRGVSGLFGLINPLALIRRSAWGWSALPCFAVRL